MGHEIAPRAIALGAVEARDVGNVVQRIPRQRRVAAAGATLDDERALVQCVFELGHRERFLVRRTVRFIGTACVC